MISDAHDTGTRDRVHVAAEEGVNSLEADRRARRRRSTLVWGLRVAFVVALLLIWQGLAAGGVINPVFIGEPTAIGASFIHLFSTTIVTTDLGTTMFETLVGFVISVVLGMACAYAMTRSSLLNQTFYPIATAANAVPRIALVPVFIIWFGLGPSSKIANVVSFVFFVVLINSLAAFAQADRDSLLLARVLGFKERDRMRTFILPGAVPVLAGTLELALIYSFLASMIGEMLGGYNGLGVSLEADANRIETDEYFAILLLVVIVVLALVQVMRYVRHRMLRWSTIEMRGE
jgi:NitT/TauT family transport system permease protein